MHGPYTVPAHFPQRGWERTHINGANGQGNSQPLLLITGRNLAHTHRSASERAGIAAQLVLGEADLVKPTIKQAVSLAHVSAPYAQLALHLKPSIRTRVAEGELTLARAALANGLLASWLAASAAERAAFGKTVGVGNLWDEAIVPSL